MVWLFIVALFFANTQATLQDHADRHAQRLAADFPALYHSNLSPLMAPGGPCAWAGENVGYGPSVAETETSFAASAGHAATAAHPRTHQARSVVRVAKDTVVVVDVFCTEARRTKPKQPPPDPTPSPSPEPPVITLEELQELLRPLGISII